MSRLRRVPWLSTALIAVSVLGVGAFDIGSAAPVAQTMNLGNQVSSLAVLPPTNVNAALSLKPLPLPPSCTAEITWTASPSSEVDEYEIRRVIALTGIVDGGPWSVVGNVVEYTDENVPLALPINTAEWQVRALVGNWSSDWVTATVDDPVLCLIGGSATAAEAPVATPVEALVEDQLIGDELPADEVPVEKVPVDEEPIAGHEPAVDGLLDVAEE